MYVCIIQIWPRAIRGHPKKMFAPLGRVRASSDADKREQGEGVVSWKWTSFSGKLFLRNEKVFTSHFIDIFSLQNKETKEIDNLYVFSGKKFYFSYIIQSFSIF